MTHPKCPECGRLIDSQGDCSDACPEATRRTREFAGGAIILAGVMLLAILAWAVL